MKFSIIIPVYNSARFLHQCIGSIVGQAFRDYELILVDDGSTDDSCAICREYAEQYGHVRLIRQENGGPSAARNRGIAEATGEYLAFVDSDDWVTPDYFAVLERAVASAPDLVFFGRQHGEEKIVTAFPAGCCASREQIIDFLTTNYFRGDVASCTVKLYARHLFADGELRFPAGTVVEEDLLFVLQAVDRSSTLVSIPDAVYFYNRRDSGSVTTQYNPIKFDCKLRACQTELGYARKWSSPALEQIFDDNYLSYISASINNLMYRACPLTRKQKLEEIRRFYRAELTLDCIRRSRGLSLRSRVMYLLIRLKLHRVSYLLHCVIFHIRRR